MRARRAVEAAAIVVLTGCATGPETTAQAQCQYFAREEGMEWVRNVKSEGGAAGATAVTMDLKDAMGRPFTATCLYADGKRSWATPLPANAVTRQQGRDTMAPPAARK